jgi:CBS domain-containing protein
MPIDAADIMTRRVVTVRPTAMIADVAKTMTEHGISAVPVCEDDGRLVGVISEGDLMQPFGEKNQLRRAWWLNLLAEGTELAPEFEAYLRLDRHRAEDLMQRDVVTAQENTPVTRVADLLWKKIKRVPILRGHDIVGVVSRADLVRALATKPEILGEPV